MSMLAYALLFMSLQIVSVSCVFFLEPKRVGSQNLRKVIRCILTLCTATNLAFMILAVVCVTMWDVS